VFCVVQALYCVCIICSGIVVVIVKHKSETAAPIPPVGVHELEELALTNNKIARKQRDKDK
jgi:predicted transcriptional regulator